MKLRFWRCTLVLLCALLLLPMPGGSASAQQTEEVRSVSVSTVDEFLEAIAPNTQIVLNSGEYNLTRARNYGRGGGAYYHWESGFDGYELVITDVENLSIIGADPMAVTISTEPRYANVLRFDNVSGLTLSSLVVGHTRERGYCVGGVLYLENCRDVEILSSRLYGCGTLGIDARNCRNIHMDGSDIYGCSYGIAYISDCENVLMENSKFYNCNILMYGFEIYSSQDVAIINSEIFDNIGESNISLFSLVSPGIYLGGLDIHDNAVANYVSEVSMAPTVESCRLLDGCDWSSNGVMPLSPEGTEWTAGELRNMKLRTVSWEPVEKPEAPKVTESADGKVHVATVDEFLAALGPNTVVYMEPGVYDLSSAATYGLPGSEYYRWDFTFDGYELVITGANGLTIEAESPELVSIVNTPRYANVLHFEHLTGMTLRNVKVGHTEATGECSGGVVCLDYVNSATIEGCKLFGCGTIGVQGRDCTNLNVFNCEIYECSDGAVWAFYCTTVRVEKCNIHDIGNEYFSEEFFQVDTTDFLVDGEEFWTAMDWQ